MISSPKQGIPRCQQNLTLAVLDLFVKTWGDFMQSPSHWKKTRTAALVTAFTVATGYAQAADISSTLVIPDVDCFLNWAEVQLPTLLKPALQPTQTIFTISYRAYTGGVFAGVDSSTNSILAVGGGFGTNVLTIGSLGTYLPVARAASCGATTTTTPATTPAAGAVLDWFRFTDANNWYFRVFVGTAAENTPDASGLIKYREIRAMNTAGTTVNWAFNSDYNRRDDVHYNGKAWVSCPLGTQNPQTPRDTQGKSESGYCDNYSRTSSQRTEEDISGKTLSSVVSTIRSYPQTYGSNSYSQWGLSSLDSSDKLQLGNAVFPTGSTLHYQTNTTLETSVGYDVRTSNEIFTYSAAVAGGGDARTSTTQACNSTEAQAAAAIQVTTLEQMTQAFKGTPCIFAQGTLSVNGVTYKSDDPNEWWSNSTLSIGTVGTASTASATAYYTTNSLIRVGFSGANAVTYFSCKQRALNGSSRNCTSIGTGSYSVETMGDARVLKLANVPSQAATLTYDRVFVERGGKVYWGYQDKLGSYQRARLNLEATNALFEQIGIPKITP